MQGYLVAVTYDLLEVSNTSAHNIWIYNGYISCTFSACNGVIKLSHTVLEF